MLDGLVLLCGGSNQERSIRGVEGGLDTDDGFLQLLLLLGGQARLIGDLEFIEDSGHGDVGLADWLDLTDGGQVGGGGASGRRSGEEHGNKEELHGVGTWVEWRKERERENAKKKK